MTHKYNLKKLFGEIRQALIGGEEHDFTQGSIKRAVFILSVPMVAEMLMESVFAIADIFFVAKLGADAIATVGLTESVMTIVYAIAVGISVAATAIVSRRVGEKKNRKASHSAYQAILTGTVISIIITILGIVFTEDILRLMNASEAVVNDYSVYMKIIFAGNIVVMLLFVNNAIFRSAGNPILSMKVLVVANIINLILDPLLIFGLGPIPAMGIKGAAIATTIGRGIAVLYQFYIFISGKGKIRFDGISLLPDFKLIKQVLVLSWGSIFQNLVATSSWIILVRFVAVYGSEVLAGYTIALRIIMFSLLPAWGISNAASTLVGQNLGAGDPLRAEKSAWMASRVNMVFMGVISFFLVVWPSQFIGLLTPDTHIIPLGTDSLRIMSIGLIMYGLGMVMVNSLNGAGDTQTPFKINVFSFWMLEIPLAWFLSQKAGLMQNGVFWSIVIAEAFMTIIALYFFKKGKWKLKKV